MKLFKKLFEFYINSSIHVALSVYALLRITEIYFDLPYNINLDFFILFGTIVGYNFVKYAEFSKLNYLNTTKNLKLIQGFTLLCFFATIYFGFQIKIETLLLFIPFGLLTLLYTFPLGLKNNLRNIPSLKIVIIALVWSGITSFLLFFDNKISFSSNAILVIIQRFLFIIVLTLPFDIRDVKFDKKHLKTFPQIIGVVQTKKIGFILLLITLIIEFFITPNPNFKYIFMIISFVLLIFLQRASIKQSKYYSSFWVEGIPILWWILINLTPLF